MLREMAGRHQLAAIVFSDAVGSSQSMRENEDRTLAMLADDFAVMRELCEKHSGRALKSTGDGLMMVFGSAGDAVLCALEIQERLGEAEKASLSHRIGIHLGDVYLSDDDAHGDGVNVAYRLQELASPGGIVLSRITYEVVKPKLGIMPKSIGARTLKGISDPIEAFEIAPRGKAGKKAASRPNRSHRAAPWAWASFVVIVLGVAAMRYKPWQNHDVLPATVVVTRSPYRNSEVERQLQELKAEVEKPQAKQADSPPLSGAALGPVTVSAPPASPAPTDATLRDQNTDRLASEAADQGENAINVAQEEMKRATLPGYTEESEKRWTNRDFEGMSAWIAAQSWATSPDGLAAKDRWDRMAAFKVWFQGQMALYPKSKPVIAAPSVVSRPVQAWLNSDGTYAFQFSQGAPRSFTFDKLPIHLIGMIYPALLDDTPDPTKVAADYTALDTESNVQRDLMNGATPANP